MDMFCWCESLSAPYFLYSNIADLGGCEFSLEVIFCSESDAGMYHASIYTTPGSALIYATEYQFQASIFVHVHGKKTAYAYLVFRHQYLVVWIWAVEY